MSISIRTLALTLALAAAAAASDAQDAPQQIPSPAPDSQKPDRPGLIRLGPIYLTPKLRIGPIGLDTNTLWIPEKQPVDFRAGGGPGLDIVVPMGPAKLILDGGVTYTYYVKHKDQRRLAGDGAARLSLERGRVHAKGEELYTRSFWRPSFEVDRRIVEDQWQTNGDLSVDLGRLSPFATVSGQRFEIPGGQEFLGTDLARTMSRSETIALAGFKYHLTGKTSLVVAGDDQLDRFRVLASRDADSNRIYGGFEVVSETRLEGRAVGGIRLFRLKGQAAEAGAHRRDPYANVQLRYRFGPRTYVEVQYVTDIAYSWFEVAGATPTEHTDSVFARLNKALWAGFDLNVFGTYMKFGTHGAITIVRDNGQRVTAVRNDTVEEGGADFGRWFRRLRIGVAAVYTNRVSTFSDFGIHGLLFGGTITYGPGLSWSR